MKINVLENTKKRLVFELEGSDHTFCNILKEELRENEAVTAAAYNISHPLVGKPKFVVETNGSTPLEAVEKALAGLKAKNNAFLKAFEAMK